VEEVATTAAAAEAAAAEAADNDDEQEHEHDVHDGRWTEIQRYKDQAQQLVCCFENMTDVVFPKWKAYIGTEELKHSPQKTLCLGCFRLFFLYVSLTQSRMYDFHFCCMTHQKQHNRTDTKKWYNPC
jgi:hypothetical protein